MAPGRSQLVAEMLRRLKARESLVAYSQAITIPGAPLHPDQVDGQDPEKWVFAPVETRVAKHHVVTMEAIQRCIERHSGRLIIMEPPGSAKSTYACAVATTWYMGRKPNANVLMVSSSGTPIIRASKKARQIGLSPEYRNLWPEPTYIPKGSSASDEWALTNGSTMFAAGILGGIVGSRADLAIIDDPVAGREEAESQLMRRKIRAAYDDDVLTRLKPGASLILIQTRWHEDDLAGSILPSDWNGESGMITCRDGQEWEVLRIPAECDRKDDPCGRQLGEMLWTEWFDERHWSQFRVVNRTWTALFQQEPKPEAGGQFDKEWFLRFPRRQAPAKDVVSFGTSDWAVTELDETNDPDFTVHGAWLYDSAGELWLVDGYKGQENTTATQAQWIRLLQRHGWTDYFAEAGVIRRAIEPNLHQLQEEAGDFVTETYLPAVRDKISNARSFRALAQHGKVHVVDGPFGDWVIALLAAFPFGKKDDAVDMCGLAGRAIDHLLKPEDTEEAERSRIAARKKQSAKPMTAQAWEQQNEADEAAERRRKRFRT